MVERGEGQVSEFLFLSTHFEKQIMIDRFNAEVRY